MEPERRSKTADSTPTSRLCPKCNVPLTQVFKEGIEINACSRCKGVWVDRVEERDAIRLKPEAFTVSELRQLRRVYQYTMKVEPIRYVPCPICRQLMFRVNWGSYSGVVVDRCDEHGTWYDEGELDTVREFVASGGAEYEKLTMLEKGLDEVNSKLIQEVTQLNQKVDSAYQRARLYSIIGL